MPGLHDGGNDDVGGFGVGAASSCSSSHSPHPPSSCAAATTMFMSERGWGYYVVICQYYIAKYQMLSNRKRYKNEKGLPVAQEMSISQAFFLSGSFCQDGGLDTTAAIVVVIVVVVVRT